MKRNGQQKAVEPFDGANATGGVRKTAIFLSILDEKTASDMLTRLEPELARAVEAELKSVGELPAEEVEAVVAEFLALSDGKGGEFDATADKRRANLANLTENRISSAEISQKPDFDAIFGAEDGESEDDFNGLDGLRGIIGIGGLDAPEDLAASDDDFQALDAFEPETLAEILRDESAAVVAVVASRLSTERRAATLRLLPPELTSGATRLAEALERRTETAQFLEDAVFNRAF